MSESMEKGRTAEEGSLDWWMGTWGPITEPERGERIRCTTLAFKTWLTARTVEEEMDVEHTMPANELCGHCLDAAAQLMSVARTVVLVRFSFWANAETFDEQREYIVRYFVEEWER